MRFAPQKTERRRARGSGFTLAEVLAALLFMAIVIPVAIEGMHIAARAGAVAARKNEAAMVAQRVLSENMVTTNFLQGGQSGTISQGHRKFEYELKTDPWTLDQSGAIRQLTVTVHYTAQSRRYQVSMSTLVDSTILNGTNSSH